MPGLTCNACNKEFLDNGEQKLHYKSDWHRYNVNCKVAGIPGLTEAVFLEKQPALAQEKDKHNETLMLYSCGSETFSHSEEEAAIVKPGDRNDEESEDEWVAVDHAADSLNGLNLNEEAPGDEEEEELDPRRCFMCDRRHDAVERCMLHMHKFHGLFIPDVEYLKDPEGLLTYLGLKVKRDFTCLYCNERCHPFTSLEAVRKHMAAKGHCRVHYGDIGDEDEEAELEEFYDYSCSYVDESGKQLIVADDMSNTVQLSSGSELVLTCRRSDQGKTTKTLGYREYLRYYRQKPPPSPAKKVPNSALLASRYRSMVTATLRSRVQIERRKAEAKKRRKEKRAKKRSAMRVMRWKSRIFQY